MITLITDSAGLIINIAPIACLQMCKLCFFVLLFRQHPDDYFCFAPVVLILVRYFSFDVIIKPSGVSSATSISGKLIK